MNKQPENVSLLSTNKYSMVFPTLPHINYFLSSVILPGVSTSEVPVGSNFATLKRHGDTLVYEPLIVTVQADEDLLTWQETYEWLVGLTKPTQFSEYIGHPKLDTTKISRQTLYTDAELTVRTNAHNPNIIYKFKDCHPISLSSIQFNNADNPEITAYFDVTFSYTYFSIARNNT